MSTVRLVELVSHEIRHGLAHVRALAVCGSRLACPRNLLPSRVEESDFGFRTRIAEEIDKFAIFVIELIELHAVV